jgi:hypothetical protein
VAHTDRGLIKDGLNKFVSAWTARIAGWTPAQRTHSEKSYSQQFWSDLLRQFGIIPERIDLFERDAVRATTSGLGWIDVFWSSVFIGEAKSVGEDLEKAERQALDYLAGGTIGQHEWPKYVLSSDFEHFRLTRLGADSWTIDFLLEALPDHIDQLMFLVGQDTVTKQDEEDASIRASKIMATLYTAMVGDEADEKVGDFAPATPEDEDEQVQEASMFLTRLLFLLYGDDAGLWEEDLFYRFVLHDTTADNLGSQIQALFQVLNTPDSRRKRVPESMAKFPYVNGSIFADTQPILYFTPAMRDALLAACRFRWTRISPAVFGSMFQMVKSKEARRTAGEHYTTQTNILKVIEPLFITEMQAEADRLCRNKSTTLRALREFAEHLATHVFADPACGSGNFLNVAYAKVRDIETQVLVEMRARAANSQQMMLDVGTLLSQVTIDQFHGIEIAWWPAKIAETAMFLVDHQANRKLALAVGDAPRRLPITITAHIHHADALNVDWTNLIPKPNGGKTFVFGNPPFLGHETRSAYQTQQLANVWAGDIGRLDYVAAWHAKALALFTDGRPGDFAFVSTNSLCQGDQAPRLFGKLVAAGWRVKFAHRTFKWTTEVPGKDKAIVHVIVVGFTREQGPATLFDYKTIADTTPSESLVDGVNEYLIEGPYLFIKPVRRPRVPWLPPAAFGNMPRDGGHLLIEPEEYAEVVADQIAAKYMREFVGAKEMLQNKKRWCLWLVNLDPADRKNSPVLTARLEAVRKFRETEPEGNKRRADSTKQMAKTPHLFGQRSQPTVPFIIIPRHFSDERRYFVAGHFPETTIVGDSAFHAVDPDGVLFAVISSSMFITWQRTVGGRIKSDPRFANTLTWNNFPLPQLEPAIKLRIIEAGEKLQSARGKFPNRSLAEMYDPLAMDPELIKAHDALDREVDKAFGATRRLTTERQRLELLFAAYADLQLVLPTVVKPATAGGRSRRSKTAAGGDS